MDSALLICGHSWQCWDYFIQKKNILSGRKCSLCCKTTFRTHGASISQNSSVGLIASVFVLCGRYFLCRHMTESRYQIAVLDLGMFNWSWFQCLCASILKWSEWPWFKFAEGRATAEESAPARVPSELLQPSEIWKYIPILFSAGRKGFLFISFKQHILFSLLYLQPENCYGRKNNRWLS